MRLNKVENKLAISRNTYNRKTYSRVSSQEG